MERTRVIGYVRVSTEGQADGGVSLDAQRAKLAAYCVALDLDLVCIEEDAGLSAKTLDRPALARALDALRAGRADALLVAKLDRLTRSVRDLGTLVDTYFAAGKWALLSVADSIDTRSAAGRLVLNVARVGRSVGTRSHGGADARCPLAPARQRREARWRCPRMEAHR